jgi:predicted MPP superfamily phosphohydrolase
MFGSIFVLAYLAITVPKVIFATTYLLDLPLKRLFKKWKIYPFTVLATIISIAIVCIVSYGSIVGKTRFQVKETEFFSSNFRSSFDGFKIVHISDLHLGSWIKQKNTMKKLVELINQQKPDIVAVTGDIVNRFASEIEEFVEIFSQISTTYGVFSVLGNHDYGLYHQWESKEKEQENFDLLKQLQANMNFELLNNENRIVVRGSDSIAIVGVENAGNHFFLNRSDLPKALIGTEGTDFKILLCHDPSFWRNKVLDTDVNLTLSGHTHGAQISLWQRSPASLFYAEWSGLYLDENKGLYVNVGIGYVGVPFRFGALPEITVIRLLSQR